MIRAALFVLLVSWAGLAQAEPRALSPQEIDDLRQGRGMGLARAADLHGYPGPRHVLEAVEAGQLQLTADQLAAVRALFDAMAADARRVGARILAEEGALEATFRAGTVDEADLRARLDRLAALQAELRFIHLRTHLATRPLLDEHQRHRYDLLRGRAPAHSH